MTLCPVECPDTTPVSDRNLEKFLFFCIHKWKKLKAYEDKHAFRSENRTFSIEESGLESFRNALKFVNLNACCTYVIVKTDAEYAEIEKTMKGHYTEKKMRKKELEYERMQESYREMNDYYRDDSPERKK